MIYMHSLEYIKQRKDGTIEKRPDGRYYLTDGRGPVTVNDGCPSAGVHTLAPAQKVEVKSDTIPFVP